MQTLRRWLEKNAFATPGMVVADSVMSGANLGAGVGGYGGLPPGTSGTQALMSATNLRKEMRPFYEMAENVRRQESERIRQSLFRTDPDNTVGKLSKGVSDLLAFQIYRRTIEPYLQAMEMELAQEGVGLPLDEVPEEYRPVIEQHRKEVRERYAKRFESYLRSRGHSTGAGTQPAGTVDYSGQDEAGRHLRTFRNVFEGRG